MFEGLRWVLVAAFRLSLIAESGGDSLVAVSRLLIAVASLVAEHSPVRHMGSVVPASRL